MSRLDDLIASALLLIHASIWTMLLWDHGISCQGEPSRGASTRQDNFQRLASSRMDSESEGPQNAPEAHLCQCIYWILIIVMMKTWWTRRFCRPSWVVLRMVHFRFGPSSSAAPFKIEPNSVDPQPARSAPSKAGAPSQFGGSYWAPNKNERLECVILHKILYVLAQIKKCNWMVLHKLWTNQKFIAQILTAATFYFTKFAHFTKPIAAHFDEGSINCHIQL